MKEKEDLGHERDQAAKAHLVTLIQTCSLLPLVSPIVSSRVLIRSYCFFSKTTSKEYLS